MASLPNSFPTLSLHLTDPVLTPLVSSSSTTPSTSSISHSSRFAALTDITTTALTAYSSTARLGLGLPQRIVIDTSKRGPAILHSFLNPEILQQKKIRPEGAAADAKAIADQTKEALRPLSGSTVEEGTSGGSEGMVSEAPGQEGTVGAEGADSEVTLAVNGQSLIDSAVKIAGVQDEDTTTDEDDGKIAPLLIATVVAPSYDKEASRAMGRLEKLGADFQKRWIEQQAAEKEAAAAAEAAETDREEDENAEG